MGAKWKEEQGFWEGAMNPSHYLFIIAKVNGFTPHTNYVRRTAKNSLVQDIRSVGWSTPRLQIKE